MKKIKTIAIFFGLITLVTIVCIPVKAEDLAENSFKRSSFFIQKSVYTHHWKDNFYDNTNLVGLEYRSNNSLLYGISRFQNSFNQKSWYIYAVKIYILREIYNIKIQSKVTAGIIHGYNDENGKYNALITKFKTFPILIPSLGLVYKKFEIDIVPLAHEGYMITTGIKF